MRKKEGDKQAAIIEAAIKVFAQLGFHGAKIYHIADNAGIATGTVYLYFSSKESILENIFESAWKQLFKSMETIINNTSLGSIEKFDFIINAVFDYFNSNPPLAMVFVNEQHRLVQKDNQQFTGFYNKTIGLIERYLREGILDKAFDSSIDPVIYSNFIFGGLRYLLLQWANDQKSYPLDMIRKCVKNLVLSGIVGKNLTNSVAFNDVAF